MNDKKKKFLIGACLAAAGLVVLTGIIGVAGRTDFASGTFQSGPLRGNDAWRVDSNGQLRLWHGNIVFGDNGVGPGYINGTATISGTYYGQKVPFINGNGSSTALGTVIIASGTATQYGIASFSATLATNTIIGISDGVYAFGTTGYMWITGVVPVLTTGTVHIGDVVISSDVQSGTGGGGGIGAAGFGGAKPTSPAAGTIIGVAISSGNANGGLTLTKLSF